MHAMTSTPPPPTRPPLPDRWHSRDFPVLLEIARGLDAGALPDQSQITADLDISADELNAAWHALCEGGYLPSRARRLPEAPRIGDRPSAEQVRDGIG